MTPACESAPYRLSQDARRHDRFWVAARDVVSLAEPPFWSADR